MTDRDRESANRFSERREAAYAHLWRLMEAHGLFARDGWKVTEFTREGHSGTELVIRPLHLWHEAPPELECVIWVHGESGSVDASCTPQPLSFDTKDY
jgi:hypothetical protein